MHITRDRLMTGVPKRHIDVRKWQLSMLVSRQLDVKELRTLKGQTEHGSVVTRNRFQLRVFLELEGATQVPGVFNRWDDPEIAFGIAHDPVFGASAVNEDGRPAAGCGDDLQVLLN